MWIAHKTKEGDTLDSIVKQYGIKDPNTILKYAKNKSLAAPLKKKEKLKAGQTVWVPDPKAKVYIVNGKKGKQVLDEKQYKEYLQNVHKTMDEVCRTQKQKLGYATGRHDAQIKINKDQWFVSSIVSAFNSAPEPGPQRRNAEAAYKRLEAATKGRKYKEFESAAFECEKQLTAYQNAVHRWVEGIIGTAESSVTVLTHIRDAGAFCGTVAAVTIAAPATLTAGVLVGAGASAGVGLTYDGYDQIGRVLAGTKERSLGEIGKRTLTNALTGAAGAAVVGGVLKFAAKPLVTAVLSKPVVAEWVRGAATSALPAKVLQAEVNNAVQNLTKKGVTITTAEYIELIGGNKITTLALTKFVARTGNGVLMKKIEANKQIGKFVESWVKKNPKALAGKDGKAAGEAVATDLAKSDASKLLLNDLLKGDIAGFQKELRTMLVEANKAVEKKMASAN